MMLLITICCYIVRNHSAAMSTA